MQVKDQSQYLNCITDELIDSGRHLQDITDMKVDCLKAFVDHKPFSDWLKKSLQSMMLCYLFVNLYFDKIIANTWLFATLCKDDERYTTELKWQKPRADTTSAAYHSLLGRSSRVLTVTGFVYGNLWFSTFHPPIRPPLTDRQKNCHRWLRRWQLPQNQILCKSAHGGFWANAWNIIKILFIYLYLFMGTHLQVRQVWQIFELDGSNDVDSRKDVPF